MSMQNRRRRYLIDSKLQWSVARRLVLTWLVGGALILAFPVSVMFLYGLLIASIPLTTLLQNIAETLWFPALTAALVIPLGIRDSIRFSNRIAGPMFRFKREITNLVDGKPTRPIQLRDKDFFSDFAEELNRLCQKVQFLEEQVQGLPKTAGGGSESDVEELAENLAELSLEANSISSVKTAIARDGAEHTC